MEALIYFPTLYVNPNPKLILDLNFKKNPTKHDFAFSVCPSVLHHLSVILLLLQAEWSAVERGGLIETEPHTATESHEQGQSVFACVC